MIVRETCAAIWQVLSGTYLKAPATEEHWKSIAEDFEQEWDLPHAVGAVDGKHIAIYCPQYGGSQYYSYKGFHNVVLMAICQARYRFTYVDIGSYGPDNDAAIFGSTSLFSDFDSDQVPLPQPRDRNGTCIPYYLVDDIFPLKNWLMKPFSGAGLSEPQSVQLPLVSSQKDDRECFWHLVCKMENLQETYPSQRHYSGQDRASSCLPA